MLVQSQCKNYDALILKICALWGFYAAQSGSFLQTFRDNLSTPSWTVRPLKIGPIDFPETSAGNFHSALRNIPEDRRSRLHRGESLKLRKVTFVLEEARLKGGPDPVPDMKQCVIF